MKRPSPKNKRPTLPTVLSLLLLTNCQMAHSEPTTSCGVLYTYDAKTESMAAQEYNAMKTAGVYPVTREFIDDYGQTRQSIRDCGI